MIRSVELIVEEAAGIDRYRSPVTQGVPFAEGELPFETPVCAADSKGAALPTQAKCLAALNGICQRRPSLCVSSNGDSGGGLFYAPAIFMYSAIRNAATWPIQPKAG